MKLILSAAKTLSADAIYHVLALVSTIGSPSVLIDIAKSIPVDSTDVNGISGCYQSCDLATAYSFYQKFEASTLKLEFRKESISIRLYEEYESLRAFYQSQINEKKSRKSSKEPDKTSVPRKSATHTLNRLIETCLKSSDTAKEESRDATKDDKTHALNKLARKCLKSSKGKKAAKNDRDRIRCIKKRGESILRFYNIIWSGSEKLGILGLIPFRRMESILDTDKHVEHYQYVIRSTAT